MNPATPRDQRTGRDGLPVSTLLVDTGALAAELAHDQAPVLLDVRWRLGGPPGIDSYRQGHLPGAVFADLDRDLAGPPGSAGRHPLPDTAAFQAAMRAAGVSRDRPVVVYDDGDATIAARGWWTLRYFGHQDVRVLDGGYRAWVRAGLGASTAEPAPAPGDFTAEPGHMAVLDAAGAQAAAQTGLLLDARAPERYRGETEPPSGGPPHSRRGQRAHRRQRAPGRHLLQRRRTHGQVRRLRGQVGRSSGRRLLRLGRYRRR